LQNWPFKDNKKKPKSKFSNEFFELANPVDAILVSKKINQTVQVKKIARYYGGECSYLGSALELSKKTSIEDFGFLIMGQNKYKRIKVSTKNLRNLDIQIPKPKHIKSGSRNDADLYAFRP
jgi:hypothetical protein